MHEQLRRDLGSALQSQEFKVAFEELKRTDGIFEKYPTPEALIALCRPGGPDPEGRDRALGAILRVLRRGNANFPLIHLMFWESLARLFRRLKRGTDDPESLFECVQMEFLRAVYRHDPDRLPMKIDVTIFLNTRRGALAWLRARDEERGHVEEYGRAGLAPVPAGDLPIPPEQLEVFLLNMLQKGALTRTQFEVVLETDVYRRATVQDWARRKGISPVTAHTHRQNAMKAMRLWLEEEGGGRAIS